jgi:hypothetical protein
MPYKASWKTNSSVTSISNLDSSLSASPAPLGGHAFYVGTANIPLEDESGNAQSTSNSSSSGTSESSSNPVGCSRDDSVAKEMSLLGKIPINNDELIEYPVFNGGPITDNHAEVNDHAEGAPIAYQPIQDEEVVPETILVPCHELPSSAQAEEVVPETILVPCHELPSSAAAAAADEEGNEIPPPPKAQYFRMNRGKRGGVLRETSPS